MKDIVDRFWKILDRISGTRPLMHFKITYGFRHAKNLSEILCRSDIRCKGTSSMTFNKKRLCQNFFICKHCRRLDKSGRIISSSTGHKYKCVKKCSCRSSSLIYCIQCNICSKQYVGQTKNELRVGMNSHLSSIRLQGDTPVPRHFKLHDNIKDPSLKVFIVQLIRQTTQIREQNDQNEWEEIWMARLFTQVPKGLSIQD